MIGPQHRTDVPIAASGGEWGIVEPQYRAGIPVESQLSFGVAIEA